jgi:hypothetical protein
MGGACDKPLDPESKPADQPVLGVASEVDETEETPDALATRVIALSRDFVVGVMGYEPGGPTKVDE